MSENENYEPDIISVTDDDGNEILFELLERYENDNGVYVAITEYRDDAEDIVEADYEVIILKVAEENGDEYLEEIEDEAEYNEVSEILMNKIEQTIRCGILRSHRAIINKKNQICSLCISTTEGLNNPNKYIKRDPGSHYGYADLPPRGGSWEHKIMRTEPTCVREQVIFSLRRMCGF